MMSTIVSTMSLGFERHFDTHEVGRNALGRRVFVAECCSVYEMIGIVHESELAFTLI
jgi:pimeloyl-CoA synthetase